MGGLENALVGVNKNVITNLEPIVIYDPNGEYFTDLSSALTCISQFGFPTPLNSYYNSNSKSLYLWYPSSYLEDMYVGYNSNTELAFGVDNLVSVEDESGFIYGFAGNSFEGNNKQEFSNPIKLKVFYSADDSAFVKCHSDLIIEQCYSNGSDFASKAVGNITIKFGVFNSSNAFATYSGTNENIATIKHLDYVGGDTFFNGFGGKVVIESINPSLLASCPGDMFTTVNPAILHLPFYAKGTAFGNFAEANIKSSVSTNRVVYDGISTLTLQEVLNNNHDLVAERNYQGTGAGVSNEGANVNAFGLYAGSGNLGDDVNAFGSDAGNANIGNHLNAFGAGAGVNNEGNNVNILGAYSSIIANIFHNINLFGRESTADGDNQTVFSKYINSTTQFFARLSFNTITADRKYELPDKDITIAGLNDITADKLIQTSSNFANDALAGAGGIAVGQLYHTAGVVKIRLT